MSLQKAQPQRYPGVDWDRSPPGIFTTDTVATACPKCGTAPEMVRHCPGERPRELCWMRLDGEHVHYRCASKNCNSEWPVRGRPAA